MNAASQLAEALAASQGLRGTARAVRAEQGALHFRLNHAADALDAMVALAMHYLERIEQLEKEMSRLLGGDQ